MYKKGELQFYNDFKRKAKTILSDETIDAVEFIFENIDADSNIFNDLIHLKGRYNQANKDLLKNIIRRDERNLVLDQVRQGILELLDNIKIQDLTFYKDSNIETQNNNIETKPTETNILKNDIEKVRNKINRHKEKLDNAASENGYFEIIIEEKRRQKGMTYTWTYEHDVSISIWGETVDIYHNKKVEYYNDTDEPLKHESDYEYESYEFEIYPSKISNIIIEENNLINLPGRKFPRSIQEVKIYFSENQRCYYEGNGKREHKFVKEIVLPFKKGKAHTVFSVLQYLIGLSSELIELEKKYYESTRR